jgi:hypothetical protein
MGIRLKIFGKGGDLIQSDFDGSLVTDKRPAVTKQALPQLSPACQPTSHQNSRRPSDPPPHDVDASPPLQSLLLSNHFATQLVHASSLQDQRGLGTAADGRTTDP